MCVCVCPLYYLNYRFVARVSIKITYNETMKLFISHITHLFNACKYVCIELTFYTSSTNYIKDVDS